MHEVLVVCDSTEFLDCIYKVKKPNPSQIHNLLDFKIRFTKFVVKGLSFTNVTSIKNSKLTVVQILRVEEISAEITHRIASIFGKRFTKLV